MKYKQLKLLICYTVFGFQSNLAFSMNFTNCSTPQSNLSDQWIIGTTITQILVGSLQVCGSLASFIGDYVFYVKSPIREVKENQKELLEEKNKFEELKTKKPKILRAIFHDISTYLKEHSSEIQDDDELIVIFEGVKKVLDKFALERESAIVGEPVL